MGLIVKGNPLGIRSVEDLARPEVHFVNRDPDSGTRILLDQMLALRQVAPSAINAIRIPNSPMPRSALSPRASPTWPRVRRRHGSRADFVPLLIRDYVFCRRQILDHPAMARVLAVMRGPEFAEAISTLPGYRVREPG